MYHFRGRYRDNRGQGNSCMAACLSRRHRVCGRKCGKALYHQYPHRPPRDRLTEQFVHTELVDVFGAFARQGSVSQLTLCILKSEDSCSSALYPKDRGRGGHTILDCTGDSQFVYVDIKFLAQSDVQQNRRYELTDELGQMLGLRV